MRIPFDQIEALTESLRGWIGQSAAIRESISRSRGVGGHDRHFATMSKFVLRLASVGITMSGVNLTLGGDINNCYQISTRHITAIAYRGDNQLEVVEQFEQQTERLSIVIRQTPPVACG